MTFERITTILLSTASALSLAACGTETGNGLVTMKLGLTSSAPGEALQTQDAQGTAFVIDAASIYVGRIDFDEPGQGACEGLSPRGNERVKCDGGKVRVNGPLSVDLIAQTAEPSLVGLEIPAGRYRRAEVRVEVGTTQRLPPGHPLGGRTLVASGRFEHRGEALTFELALAFSDTLRFESADGVEVGAGGASELLLELDVERWFSALPITQCLEDGDLPVTNGLVRIENRGRRCGAIETALRSQIQGSGRLR